MIAGAGTPNARAIASAESTRSRPNNGTTGRSEKTRTTPPAVIAAAPRIRARTRRTCRARGGCRYT